MLMRAAAAEYKWNLNYGGIALMWRGGCIHPFAFLGKIKEAYDSNPKLMEPAVGRLFFAAKSNAARKAGAMSSRRREKGIPTPRSARARVRIRSAVCRRLVAGDTRIISARHLRSAGQAAREFSTRLDGKGGMTSSGSYMFKN